VNSDVAGSAAYVYSVHMYPQSRDLNQMQSTLSNFTTNNHFPNLISTTRPPKSLKTVIIEEYAKIYHRILN